MVVTVSEGGGSCAVTTPASASASGSSTTPISVNPAAWQLALGLGDLQPDDVEHPDLVDLVVVARPEEQVEQRGDGRQRQHHQQHVQPGPARLLRLVLPQDAASSGSLQPGVGRHDGDRRGPRHARGHGGGVGYRRCGHPADPGPGQG